MIIQDNLPIPSFTYPSKAKRLVCCDFDETYLPFRQEDKIHSGINKLENLIQGNSEELSLLIGWVTGSSLKAALRKSAGYVTRLPHFIASSLGTELYWIKGIELHESDEWIERINQAGYKKSDMPEMVALLENEDIPLIYQDIDYQGNYIESYYYRISRNMTNDFTTIKSIAAQFNCKVLFTKCNPGAGDPPDCYDVQFLPTCCGKEQVLQFLSKQLNIEHQNTWAFGDSFNDIRMLQSAGNGFLVANADPKAKNAFHAVLKENYCTGIANKLSELL